MNKSELQLFLTSYADSLMRLEPTRMAAFYKLPVAYYLPGQLMVFSDPDLLAQRFSQYQRFLRQFNVTRITPQDIKLLDVSKKRAFVQLDWAYRDKDGDTLRTSTVQYVLCRERTAADLRIELVDYTVVGFPQFIERVFS